jgi:hypothetical protein
MPFALMSDKQGISDMGAGDPRTDINPFIGSKEPTQPRMKRPTLLGSPC